MTIKVTFEWLGGDGRKHKGTFEMPFNQSETLLADIVAKAQARAKELGGRMIEKKVNIEFI